MSSKKGESRSKVDVVSQQNNPPMSGTSSTQKFNSSQKQQIGQGSTRQEENVANNSQKGPYISNPGRGSTGGRGTKSGGRTGGN